MTATNPDCGRLFRDLDWALTPLGPMEEWGVELKTLTNVMLGSLQPMLMVWGPSQITLYNDGYAAMCGNRHPHAFGKPFRDLWHDIWDQVDPIITAAYNGHGTAMDDIQFTMHRNGYPEETHFAFSYTPVRDPWGTVLGMFCACNEITAQVAMARKERTQRERFMQVFELNPGGIAMLVGPDHTFDYANEQYYAMIGVGREIIGKTVAEAVSEVVRQGFIKILDDVYFTGEPFIAKNLPVELNRGPEGEMQTRLIDLVYQPMRGENGSVTGILVQAQDVTQLRAEEERQTLLSHELGHRLKNQLAMVQAIASQTLRTAPDIATARKRLSDRISVLSDAHDVILEGGRGSSTVRQLVGQMTALHDDVAKPRISTSGPDLRIGSRPSLSLSLILHELATNAVKHGALSLATGRIDLKWRVGGLQRDRFELEWIESGVPCIVAPASNGSGMRLISAGLNGTSDSSVNIEYGPEGIRCFITADLETFQKEH
ncbi:PAS domain-containing protein [Rhizobium sp. CG4]|jgi:two-component sensor histidine kinase/PAS domain-containing protein|uniref:PAS domain-containing sensor histidine kinase n=1 Tax=Rhizobium/Agrobacterium group TaxID=227290 RepID=UPI0020343615|nr:MULTISPECIES: HWE histidine kinase domain-containing protein [Rhizobium/Agrobacterium group]MCM2458579.1 PAS domain-containing protein [Rhizobium sp. CG4]MDO5897161.1 HWE histidine kinase domain-containing protein [Agrobacterium sp. Azo12]